MIVMNQIRQKIVMYFILGLTLGLVALGITAFIFVMKLKGYENATDKNFRERYLTTIYYFNRDVVQGEQIKSEYLTPKSIHVETKTASMIVSPAEIVGKVAKFNIPNSIIALKSMATDELPRTDIRIQEYNMVLLPTELRENETVDIRIQFPTGQDYVVLVGKTIKKLSGNTIWLDVNEPEMTLMTGAVIDSYLYEGTKLYAIKYNDTEAQIRPQSEKDAALKQLKDDIKTKLYNSDVDTETFTKDFFDLANRYVQIDKVNQKTVLPTYNPNSQILDLMQTNPNITTTNIEGILDLKTVPYNMRAQIRANMENSILSYKVQNEEDYSKVPQKMLENINQQKTERTKIIGQ